MRQLRAVDRLVVDVALDNLSDSYSSKPPHVSPEFNNVMAAGAPELSGPTLCCAQLALALVLTAHVGPRRHTLLFDAGPEGALFVRNCRNLGVMLTEVEEIVVSDGHWDHMGALLDALDHIAPPSQGRPIPCHVNPGNEWRDSQSIGLREGTPRSPLPARPRSGLGARPPDHG